MALGRAAGKLSTARRALSEPSPCVPTPLWFANPGAHCECRTASSLRTRVRTGITSRRACLRYVVHRARQARFSNSRIKRPIASSRTLGSGINCGPQQENHSIR